jgi:hypothetical protein
MLHPHVAPMLRPTVSGPRSVPALTERHRIECDALRRCYHRTLTSRASRAVCRTTGQSRGSNPRAFTSSRRASRNRTGHTLRARRTPCGVAARVATVHSVARHPVRPDELVAVADRRPHLPRPLVDRQLRLRRVVVAATVHVRRVVAHRIAARLPRTHRLRLRRPATRYRQRQHQDRHVASEVSGTTMPR